MIYTEIAGHPCFTETRSKIAEADGYLFLGMPHEALKVLRSVDQDDAANIEVVYAITQTLLFLKDWNEANLIAKAASCIYPKFIRFVEQRMFALRRLGNADEYFNIIICSSRRFRMCDIYYDLACFEALGGIMQDARTFLKIALGLDPSLKKVARKDPDLKTLFS